MSFLKEYGELPYKFGLKMLEKNEKLEESNF